MEAQVMKTIIIGGVAGGASAAARLRRLDESAEIILLERGEHISFANCGLPYYIGGDIQDKSALTLQTPTSFGGRFRVDVRVLSKAVAINAGEKAVTIRDRTTGREYIERYDRLIFAPGASPIVPSVPGVDNMGVFTLRNIPDTLRIKSFVVENTPKKAVVVGGGFIGIEMAENLAQCGMEVTIVEMAGHLVASLDSDTACDLHAHLREKGVALELSNTLAAIEKDGPDLIVRLANGEVRAQLVVLSIGVRPESGLAAAVGLELNERGCVVVDEHMRTSDPSIYAVGDVVECVSFITGAPAYIPLAGPANRQGRIAADNICGIDSRYTGTQGSAVAKVFDMIVACTGVTEAAAKAQGIACDKVHLYSASHATYYPGAQMMSLKLLFEIPTGRVLGAQILGVSGVEKRCDVLATAIRANMTVYDLTRLELCYAPPYSSAKDPVNMAGFVAENILTGKVKNFHWENLDALDRTATAILDVRTEGEASHGKLGDSIHIPLDLLRGRLGELDQSKTLYVHCHSGLRSYIACRILAANGFDCYNISGGWRLYSAMQADTRTRS